MLAGQCSLDEIATAHGVNRATLHRHIGHVELSGAKTLEFRNWMAQRAQRRPGAAIERKLARLDESDEATAPSPGQVYRRLYLLEGEALGLLERAKQQDAVRDAVSAIRAAESLLVRISELSGYLKPAQTSVAVGVVVGSEQQDFDGFVTEMLEEIARVAHPRCAKCGEACSLCASELVEPPKSIAEKMARLAAQAKDRYPGGPLSDVDDAEVVEDAQAVETPQTPPRQALPAPCPDGCRCWRCKDKPKQAHGGQIGPISVVGRR